MTDRSKEFEAWALNEGYDVAGTYDTERSRWVWLNPMTADLSVAWTDARAEGMKYAAKLCDRRVMGDNNREDAEAKRCADAIRAAIGEMT